MSLLARLFSAFAVSPYPWTYTLSYAWFARSPSFRNHTGLLPAPLSAGHSPGSVARVVVFGDLIHLSEPPAVGPDIREVFAQADLVLGNLEGPLRPEKAGSSVWLKAIDPAYLQGVLESIGVEPAKVVLSVANNHSQDAGSDGLVETLSSLGDLGIEAIGQVIDGVPTTATRTLPSGLRVGLAAWTHWLNTPPGQRFDDPGRLDVLRAEAATEVVSNLLGDTRIALPHWDFEYQHFPSVETTAMARALAVAGCDIVGGAHPHVAQPLDVLGNCHVLYSHGNLLPGGPLSRSLGSQLGLISEFELHTAGEHRGRVAGYRVHPFLHDRERGELRMLTRDQSDAWAILSRVFDTGGTSLSPPPRS